MTLRELSRALPGGTLCPPSADAVIARVEHRSDRAEPGALFACLPGGRVDGHDFAGAALAAGASALLVERPLALDAPQLVVPDTRLALALAAAALAGHPSQALTVVGITGTNGKTTCAFLAQSVLRAALGSAGLIGTIEARVGGVAVSVRHTTPDPAELHDLLARMRAAGDAACAMEVSSHALAQRRVAGVRFAAALFTNLTRDHLDYHPDLERYYAAKRGLFRRPAAEGADPPGAANLDDPFGRRLAGETGALGYAVDAAAEVHPLTARQSGEGTWARLRTPRGPLEIESRLRGRFNLANLCGVVAVGEVLGLDHAAVAGGIAAVAGVPGRFEAVESDESDRRPSVIVDYAHTPDSLENVLRTARELAEGSGGKLWVVFGCGGDRDRGKRPQMGAIARRLADHAVVTSDNPRSEDPDAIIAEILSGATAADDGVAELVAEADRARAIALAIDRADPLDVVLIAGKGHEPGQERNGVVTPFDDREVARATLARSAA